MTTFFKLIHMFSSTKIKNYLIGRGQTLNYKLKKLREQLVIYSKEAVKFNYPKSKRVIYEKTCYLLNFPTYWKRKYLGNKLRRQQQENPLGYISPASGYKSYSNLDFPPLNQAIAYAKTKLADTDVAALVAKAEGKHKYLLALPIKHELTLDSPLLQLALNPALLSTVTEYMGILPILNSVNILYSPNQSIFAHSSQYLHLDPEGIRQVKVFIYLDDVDTETGPFTLIPAGESAKIYPVYKGGRLTDEFVTSIIAPAQFTPITGPGGTMILVDTSSCFHFGSRPGSKDRPAILLQYISPFSMIFPRFGWQRKTRLAHLVKEDTPKLERYLLGVL